MICFALAAMLLVVSAVTMDSGWAIAAAIFVIAGFIWSAVFDFAEEDEL